MKRYYIAYGSNLNLRQMNRRCPGARILGTGCIEGYRLLFKGSKTGSYLTIEKAEGYKLPFVLWNITPDDEKFLDIYEGYPSFYYKQDFKVDVLGIRTKRKYTKRAFAYIMHEDHKLGIPSESYMDTCLEGYKTFGFDKNYLIEALNFSKEEC